MPNPLISFRVEPELLDALDRFAQENGLDRTAVIRNAIRRYISVPIDPIDGRLADLEKRVTELERRLGTTGENPVDLSPLAIEQECVDDNIGISQNQLIALCRCNDRRLRSIRDRPDQLAEFTRQRTGQAYEYRGGRYYPVRG